MKTIGDAEKAFEVEQTTKSKHAADPEKGTAYIVSTISDSTVETKPGRPDIPALMEELVDDADSTKQVIVGACGPEGLLKTVKGTASRCIRPDGPSFTMHTEVG
jgi:hypothetical protein